MAAKIFRINYKSDFILTLNSDAGWMTPFCIKFWTGAPSQAFFVGWDGETYTHCAPVAGEPTKLLVQFDDHHLPIGDLKFQIAYHFTVADFPNDTEDEVINPANITTEIDGETYQVMLDFTGETAPEIEFSLPAYANEAQRIANEQQRIANEQTRIENEQTRISNEQTRVAHEQTRQQNEAQRIAQESARVSEFASLKSASESATRDANNAATLANEKAQLADDKAALADGAATQASINAVYAHDEGQLAGQKAIEAAQATQLATNEAAFAHDQGTYAKNQGDYAKEQGDTALADHVRANEDHSTAAADHTTAGNDHTRAESDHSTSAADHTTAGNDHTRAESDHGIASDDHTQAGNDHTRAESDHTTAAADHTQAGNDHTRAESDHTRAESDHAAVEVYVDSLGAFDISAYHATGGVLAEYADLTAALGTNGANVPESMRKGGMSVKFVQSSDNTYVQFRLMAQSFTTDITQWQGVDDEPTDGSKNLVESGGAFLALGKKESPIPFIIDGGVSLNKYFKELYIVGLNSQTVYCVRGLKLENGTITFNIGTSSGIVVGFSDIPISSKIFKETSNNITIYAVFTNLNEITGTIIDGNTDTTIGTINQEYCCNLNYSPIICNYLQPNVGHPFINVNMLNNKSDAYGSMGDARVAVPQELRKNGLQITYLLDSMWITEEYTGGGTWTSDSSWKLLNVNAEIFNLNLLFGQSTAYESKNAARSAYNTFCTSLKITNKQGVVLTYLLSSGWQIEQVLSNSGSVLDANYATIALLSDVAVVNTKTEKIINTLGISKEFGSVSLTTYNGHINNDGTYASNLTGKTADVYLEKGTIIKFTSRAYNGFCQFAKVIQSGVTYKPLYTTSSTSLITDSVYWFITESGYYAISSWNETYLSLSTAVSDTLKSLESNMEDFALRSKDITYVEITANSDLNSDADFKGNSAIRDAIASIVDASESKQYIIKCTGDFIAELPSDYDNSVLTTLGQSAMFWLKDYVHIDGGDSALCRIRATLPDSLAECQADTPSFVQSDYGKYQPIFIRTKSNVSNITVSTRNGRYAYHIEGGSLAVLKDATNELKNCIVIHEGKYGDAVETTGGTALGIGINSGQNINIINCVLRSSEGGASCHDNVSFAKKAKILFDSCDIQTSLGVNKGLIVYSGGSGNPVGYDFIVRDCRMVPFAFCQIKDVTAHNYIDGFMPNVQCNNAPLPIYNETNAIALRVKSLTDNNSSVRFDKDSNAFDLIIGNSKNVAFDELNRYGKSSQYGYMWRDGGVGLSAEAIGTVNLYENGTLNLGKRLGDCSGTSKTLTVIIDGTSHTITFNQNYTNISNADILTAINTALSGYGVADFYKVTLDYYPSFKSVSNVQVEDTSAVIAGMGVVFVANGHVRRAKSTDGYISGIALDSGANGQYIRIITSGGMTYKGMRFSVYQTQNMSISDIPVGMLMGISSQNDGEFTSDTSKYTTPVLRSNFGGYGVYII